MLQYAYRSTPLAKSSKTCLRSCSASLRFFGASSLAQISIGIKRYETAFGCRTNTVQRWCGQNAIPSELSNEYVFRFNRRFWPMAAFDSVLKIAASSGSVPYFPYSPGTARRFRKESNVA